MMKAVSPIIFLSFSVYPLSVDNRHNIGGRHTRKSLFCFIPIKPLLRKS